MYYSDELIEEVRSKNDIVDVISGYVRMQKKGSNYFGLCPFHNEKSSSFSVSPGKQMYYCFGCGAGGNVLTFIMEYENYTFSEAMKLLAERAGIKLPEGEDSDQHRQQQNRRARLLEVNKEAAKYFYFQLRTERGKLGMDYFRKRQLSEETMKQFGLGFSHKTSDDLVKYLKSKGYEDALIIEAGLASFDERFGLHDKFWNRVMFPIQDSNHRVIGFGGRVMGDGSPKYLNSPETPIFDKSRNLYGLNFARTSRKNHFILCEGYMDVIAMHQAGFNQAVASLGTAFTSGQANILRRYSEYVYLAYDSDAAGTNAALRALGILREVGMTGKIINMQPYKDPDEFIKNLGAEEFARRIEQAENSFLFEIRILERNYNLKDPEEKTRFHREIAKRLCNFSEETERDNYLQVVAEKYMIGVEALRKLVLSYATQTGLAKPIERPKSGVQSKTDLEKARKLRQRMLITWIADEPELWVKAKKYITPADFTVELYAKVAKRLFEDIENGQYNPAAIINMFTEEEEQREAAALFHTTLEQYEDTDRAKAFKDILMGVKSESLQYYDARSGSDLQAVVEVLNAKKALEELARTHISLN